jgi:YD repeat-containing protein
MRDEPRPLWGRSPIASATTPTGLFASYSASSGSTSLYSETIVSRDGADRITERTETIASTTTDWVYGHDAAGRLTTVKKTGTLVSQYGYDADDNRMSATLNGGTQIIPVYDAQDRLTAYGSVRRSTMGGTASFSPRQPARKS